MKDISRKYNSMTDFSNFTLLHTSTGFFDFSKNLEEGRQGGRMQNREWETKNLNLFSPTLQSVQEHPLYTRTTNCLIIGENIFECLWNSLCFLFSDLEFLVFIFVYFEKWIRERWGIDVTTDQFSAGLPPAFDLGDQQSTTLS